MQIKLPKETKDLRIRHYKAYMNPLFGEDMGIELMVKFLAEFTGLDENLLKSNSNKDNIKVYNHAVNLMNSFELSKPPEEITIKGTIYSRVNPDKVSTGWHIDFDRTDTKTEFVRLACLFYYPKGGRYGAVDDNSNLVHPIHERYEDFENEFPLTTLLNAAGFFLLQLKELINKSTETKKTEIKVRLLLDSLSGKKA